MGIEDRDWYRNNYKQMAGNDKNVLATVINQTEKRRRTSPLKTVIVWMAFVVVLYAAFTLASHFTH